MSQILKTEEAFFRSQILLVFMTRLTSTFSRLENSMANTRCVPGIVHISSHFIFVTILRRKCSYHFIDQVNKDSNRLYYFLIPQNR